MPYTPTEKGDTVWKGPPPVCERCKQTATREFLWDDGVDLHLYVTVCDSGHAKIEAEIRKDTLMCENCGVRPATEEHVERNALNDIPGRLPGKKNGDWPDWLTWGLCRECFEDEERAKFHAMQHNKEMITVEVDENTAEAKLLFSEEFHQTSSTFKVGVIQDLISALQPLYEQYVHDLYEKGD